MTESGRFLDYYIRHCQSLAHTDAKSIGAQQARLFLADIPQAKRILFDAHQAAVFDETALDMPSSMQMRLHLPFENFYLEFSEGVHTVAPQFDGEERIRAFLLVEDNDWYALLFISQGIGPRSTMVQGGCFLDKGWLAPYMPAHYLPYLRSHAAADTPPQDMLLLGDPAREHGREEQVILHRVGLFHWCLAYMMAKGIVIEREHVTRQERRWLERRGQEPEPWHVIKLEPRLVRTVEAERQGEGTPHSYRYDVVGHLRFGRHRVKISASTWSYKETVEWVPPHQRGLANATYIPATYKVEGGKVPIPEMGRYFQVERSEQHEDIRL